MGRPCLRLEAGECCSGLGRSAAATFSFALFVSGSLGRPGGLPSCQEEVGGRRHSAPDETGRWEL